MKTIILILQLITISIFTIGVSSHNALCDPLAPVNSSNTTEVSSKFYLLLNDESLYSYQPYQMDVKHIQRLGRVKDLKQLTQLADSIEQEWGRQNDTRGYFALMDEITNVLRSYTFESSDGVKQYDLTQKYVLATLSHGNVPLDITARLLPRLIPEEMLMLYKKPFDKSDWAKVRTQRAPLWLQTRQRLKQLIIPDYDFTSPVFLGFPTDLQALKNPKQEIARHKAISDNNKKIQERNEQSLVRFQEKLFSPMAEEEIVSYYSQPPYDSLELKQFLDSYVEDTKIKQQILEQVANKIASAIPK